MLCKNCNKNESVKYSKYSNGEFCSRKCSKSYSSKEKRLEINKKVSDTLKGRNDYIWNKSEYYIFCEVCNKKIKKPKSKIHQHNFCSRNCYLKYDKLNVGTGGYRYNSGRGKSGWYKGYYCSSSYELAYIIYCLDKNIHVVRNTKGFEYKFNDKARHYYPDFIVDGEYIEIKGFKRVEDDSKWASFPYKLKVLFKKDLIDIFDYVVSKYGNDYISMYESTY